MVLYKICARSLWEEAQLLGRFEGSADDRADGYVHLSTAEQAPETLARHYAGQTDLVLLTVDGPRLGPSLRWEPSRRGELFPHVYGPIPLRAVLGARALPQGPDGGPVLPVLST